MLKYFSTEIISIDTMDDSVAARTPGLSHSVSMSEHSSSRYDQVACLMLSHLNNQSLSRVRSALL